MTELQERINALEDTEEQLEIARGQDAVAHAMIDNLESENQRLQIMVGRLE